MSSDPSKPNRRQRRKEQDRLPIFEAEPQESDEEKDEHTGDPEEENFNPMLTQIYDFLFRDKAAAWTAIFTCVLAIFSYLLWKVSDSANDVSVATQAASVSSIGPGLQKIANPDGKTLRGYTVVFTWVNSGNTPTRTAELQSNVYVGTESPTKGLDFNQLPQARITTAVIAPHAAIQTSPDPISLADLEDVQNGKKHMFFWGWAVYHDQFSPAARLSEYCFDVEGATWTKPDHTDFTGDMQIINSPCGTHFCFNEECEDYKTRTK
ncbi:MAG: hypothetical protein WCD47_03235 [Candidatus Sulfotelmatobacter sp.]